jgi:hypothetical protein
MMGDKNLVTLSGKALKEILSYIAPDDTEEQLESEVTLVEKDAFISTDSEEMPAGLYVCLAEYPEEGLYGPIGQEVTTEK